MYIKVKDSSTQKIILLNLDLIHKFEPSGIETVAHYSNGNLIRLAQTMEEIEAKVFINTKKTKND